jgi:predicted SnoaL-like aldol condensation-catalyzing enzyme
MKTKLILLLLMLPAFGSALTAQNEARNKMLVQKAIEHINARDFEAFGKMLAPTYTELSAPPGTPKGPASGVEGIKAFVSAFPDMKITIKEMVAEGNKVYMLSETTGTFTNDFQGMKPTGKTFRIEDVDIVEISPDGQALSHRTIQDPMVMLMQVGVPMPAGKN